MDDMQPDNNMPMGQEDHEGAMAKADLYKLANYSFKLFKKIEPEAQLEGWVQAKITKAADYIASVYHYLEYEMKFNQYGQALDNSDVLSESQKAELKNKLMEAKTAMKELKKKQAEKLSGKKVEESKAKCTCEDSKDTCKVHGMEEGFEASAKVGDTFKTKTGVATKTKTGVKHTNTSHSDEEHGEANTTHAKSKSAAEKKAEAPKQKKSKSGTWGMEGGEKFDNRKNEGFEANAKPGDTFKTKTGVATKTKTGVKHTNTSHSDEEHGEPASKVKEKSAAEKKADKEKEIKLPKHKGNTWGMKGGEKFGKKMEEGAKPDFLDMDKDGDKKEPMKKAVADKKSKKEPKKVAEAMWKKVKESVKVAEAEKKAKKDYDGDGKIESGKDEHAGSVDKAIKAAKAKETVKESADFSRMQEQLARLNRSESHVLKESSDADQIRELTKRLLG